MASWQELSRENLKAAKLLAGDRARSSMSRSYYAAFSAVSAELQRVSHEFPAGWETPRHKSITRLLSDHGHPEWKSEVSLHMSELYKFRIDADYSSSASLYSNQAEHCVKLAKRVMRLIGVLP